MAALLAVGAAAMAFAYTVLLRLPPGAVRLVAALPWMAALWRLAWNLPTVHLRALGSFFFTWMIPFKLLLLCFDLGPGSDPAVNTSFPKFFASMALSFNIPQRHRSQKYAPEPWYRVLSRALLKFVLVALSFKFYAKRNDPNMPLVVLYFAYSLHIYLACSLIFESLASVASATIGLSMEPQFNSPFLASSMADFWGRRWNILVSSILRASIYDPLLDWFAAKDSSASYKLVPKATATIAVFLVSGLMHELIFFYMNRSAPTWQVTAFFLVNGLATVFEFAAKKVNKGRIRIPTCLAIFLTLAFIFSTSYWLFFPPIHKTGTCFEALNEFEFFLGMVRRQLFTIQDDLIMWQSQLFYNTR